MPFQRLIQQIALEFGLPIVLLGLIFWVGGEVLQNLTLSQSRSITTSSSDELGPNVEIPVDSIVIRAEIELAQRQTKVEVTQLNSSEPPLELTFPTTQTSQIETQIAETLGISTQEVKDQIRYRVNSNPTGAP